jgi:hypothetical protein
MKMKIAFLSNEQQLPELQGDNIAGSRKHLLKVDYYSMEEKLLPMLDCAVYDVIVIYPKGEASSCGEIISQVKMREKYTAFFNGQTWVFDIRDIIFLESYYRKTSVVIESGKIRIRAKLDEEERRLPEDQFIRINRHNIINMQYVRTVKGEVVVMQNGEVLFINDARRKKFEKRYLKYLEINFMLL